jgi:hypothetical protein
MAGTIYREREVQKNGAEELSRQLIGPRVSAEGTRRSQLYGRNPFFVAACLVFECVEGQLKYSTSFTPRGGAS